MSQHLFKEDKDMLAFERGKQGRKPRAVIEKLELWLSTVVGEIEEEKAIA